uniref:Uncharacterized protein n=1 Tax=Cannabis sativa TaxID=3483 RepID=A0A803P0S2_CANSA
MASSTHRSIYSAGGATSAPPPTPSTQPNNLLSTNEGAGADADALSRLLHRLPPSLALPTRRRVGLQAATCPPVISFTDRTDDNDSVGNNSIMEDLLSSASQLGFFQLINHSISSELAKRGRRRRRRTRRVFLSGRVVCGRVERVAFIILVRVDSGARESRVRIVELLSGSVGFDNPLGKDGPDRFCTLMWISSESSPGNEMMTSGGFYPYIVGLQYQIRGGKSSLLADSGRVTVSPLADSVLVTIGDIAQVSSNLL